LVAIAADQSGKARQAAGPHAAAVVKRQIAKRGSRPPIDRAQNFDDVKAYRNGKKDREKVLNNKSLGSRLVAPACSRRGPCAIARQTQPKDAGAVPSRSTCVAPRFQDHAAGDPSRLEARALRSSSQIARL
jgi:hypothetical protein